MFERILAPLDGSKTAEMVLPYVIEVASKCGSRVVIVRVSEPGGSVQECRSYLENIARLINNRVKDFPLKQPELELKVLMGNPPREILNCATEIECNLIAMASTGASGQSQWPLGNVTGKVLRASNCPVLLVRKQVNEEILKGKGLIKRIMVPLDGSKLSETALPFAEEMSTKIGAEIVLFQAIGLETFVMSPGLAMTSGMATERGYTVISSQTRQRAVSYLDGIKNSLEKKGVQASTAIEEGLPAVKIIDYAEANSIDLIVMSTHGLSGIGRWVFGSVTDKVLHAGETPVLVVRTGTMRR